MRSKIMTTCCIILLLAAIIPSTAGGYCIRGGEEKFCDKCYFDPNDGRAKCGEVDYDAYCVCDDETWNPVCSAKEFCDYIPSAPGPGECTPEPDPKLCPKSLFFPNPEMNQPVLTNVKTPEFKEVVSRLETEVKNLATIKERPLETAEPDKSSDK